jgi:hypothetical protein
MSGESTRKLKRIFEHRDLPANILTPLEKSH